MFEVEIMSKLCFHGVRSISILIVCGVEMAGNEKSNKGSLRWEMEGGIRAGVPHPMAMGGSRVNLAPPVPRAPVRMLRP